VKKVRHVNVFFQVKTFHDINGDYVWNVAIVTVSCHISFLVR